MKKLFMAVFLCTSLSLSGKASERICLSVTSVNDQSEVSGIELDEDFIKTGEEVLFGTQDGLNHSTIRLAKLIVGDSLFKLCFNDDFSYPSITNLNDPDTVAIKSVKMGDVNGEVSIQF